MAARPRERGGARRSARPSHSCNASHSCMLQFLAIFKMFSSLRRGRRYLRLDAQLRVVAGLVVPDRQTHRHTHRPSTVTLAHARRGLMKALKCTTLGGISQRRNVDPCARATYHESVRYGIEENACQRRKCLSSFLLEIRC